MDWQSICPRSALAFMVQSVVIVIVVTAAVVNLSLGSDDAESW